MTKKSTNRKAMDETDVLLKFLNKSCSRRKEKFEKHEVSQPQAWHSAKGETDAVRSTSYSDVNNKPETSTEISNVEDDKVNTEFCNRHITIIRKEKRRIKSTTKTDVDNILGHECLAIYLRNRGHLKNKVNTEFCNRRIRITWKGKRRIKSTRTDVDNLLGHKCLAIYLRNRGHLKNNQNSSISEKNYVSQETASYACGLKDDCSMSSKVSDEMGKCGCLYDFKSTPELQVEDMENAKKKQESIFINFMIAEFAQLHHREKECAMQMLEKCILESAGNCKSHQDRHRKDNKIATSENEVQSSNLVPRKKENHVPQQEVNFPCVIKDEENIIFPNHLVNTSEPSNGGEETKRSSTCRSKSSEDTQTLDNFAETFEQDSCIGHQSLIVGCLKTLSPDMTREQMIATNRRLLSPEKSFIRREKKLLVLDLNGLLADVLYVSHCSDKVYKRIKGKSVFKRPFCDEFLNFCFEAFHVGLWSSRQKKNIDPMVDYLMGERKHELLFCWDISKCTQTDFRTLENFHKPLVLKELKRLWNKEEMDLPWDKGTYLPWNTLLLDDSPYKALCNPPYTAVFPPSYSYLDENDNSLGPGGDIRVYLEGLVTANDVQYYVQQNSFGQSPITEMHSSWLFYQRVIETVNHSFHPSFSMS